MVGLVIFGAQTVGWRKRRAMTPTRDPNFVLQKQQQKQQQVAAKDGIAALLCVGLSPALPMPQQ